MHKHSAKHRFATLLWDNLPHGGASQVHPHIHATVHTEHFYGWKIAEAKKKNVRENDVFSGYFESLRHAAERYFRDWKDKEEEKQKNFFRAIQDVHIALNLTVSLNGISVLVPIVSLRSPLMCVDNRRECSVRCPNVVSTDNTSLSVRRSDWCCSASPRLNSIVNETISRRSSRTVRSASFRLVEVFSKRKKTFFSTFPFDRPPTICS